MRYGVTKVDKIHEFYLSQRNSSNNGVSIIINDHQPYYRSHKIKIMTPYPIKFMDIIGHHNLFVQCNMFLSARANLQLVCCVSKKFKWVVIIVSRHIIHKSYIPY